MKFLSLIFGIMVFSVSAGAISEPRIDATFVQLQSWMMKMSHDEWTQEMGAMKKAGINTIVLQWLQYDSTRYYPTYAPLTDPTEEILAYADKNDMKVFMGLTFDNRWWTLWNDEFFLKSVAKKNEKFAKKVWNRYGDHPSFAGWYLPFEVTDSDYDAEAANLLRNFMKYMARACRKVSKGRRLPVATSSYFQGNYAPRDTEKMLLPVFKGSGLDILMVQDGVGANAWEENDMYSVAQYLKMYQSVTEQAGIQMWTVVESFHTKRDEEGKDLGRIPADLKRILDQIQMDAKYSSRLITFDFFHYMSPYRGAAQKKLFDEYMDSLKP